MGASEPGLRGALPWILQWPPAGKPAPFPAAPPQPEPSEPCSSALFTKHKTTTSLGAVVMFPLSMWQVPESDAWAAVETWQPLINKGASEESSRAVGGQGEGGQPSQRRQQNSGRAAPQPSAKWGGGLLSILRGAWRLVPGPFGMPLRTEWLHANKYS